VDRPATGSGLAGRAAAPDGGIVETVVEIEVGLLAAVTIRAALAWLP